METYTYEKQVNSEKLMLEIIASLNLNLNGTDGNICVCSEGCAVNTIVALTSEQKTTLDGVIDAHTTSFPEQEFSEQGFITRFAEEFDTLERLEFCKHAPNFLAEMNFKNFHAIRELRDYLLTTEAITQLQADTITTIFAEQNIHLENY